MPAAAKPAPRTIRVAAVGRQLNWAFRQTCSNERFDLATAQSYMADQLERSLALMASAAKNGADLVLGSEYFHGSELFVCPPEDRLRLVATVDGPACRRLAALAGSHGTHLCASLSARHGNAIAQTAVLFGRQGQLIGTHLKHNSLPPDGSLQPTLELLTADFGPVGILICADVTDDPANAESMAERGMRLLLVPGVGFAGKEWRQVLTSRAAEIDCPIVYADTSRAMIVSRKGEVLAEGAGDELLIAAALEL